MRTLILALVTLSSFAFAQTQQPAAKQPPKPQQVDFEPNDVTGKQLLPTGSYIPVKPRVGGFKSLIQVRGDFNDKLAASVYDL